MMLSMKGCHNTIHLSPGPPDDVREREPGGADAPDDLAADRRAGVARQVEQERLDDRAGGVSGVLRGKQVSWILD